MFFSTWSMGDNRQPAMQKRMERYFTPERPPHHALHDAHALRLLMQYTLESGWIGGYLQRWRERPIETQ
jgi:hypothetical protein